MIQPASPRLPIVFASLGHFCLHVQTGLFLTVVLALEKSWALPYDRLIGLWTAGALLLGLGAPLAGWLSDRFGETPLMIAFFLGCGIATVACGLAVGPTSLAVCLALMGAFGAIYHPVGSAWVMRNPAARGKTMATVGMFGGLGLALAAIIAGGLTALAGWRAAFIVPGAVSVVLGFVLLRYLSLGRITRAEPAPAPAAGPPPGQVRRAFAVLAVTMSLSSVVYSSFVTMLPKWLSLAAGAAVGGGIFGIGALVSGVFLAATFAQFVGGHFADRGSAKAIYVASYGFKLLALLLAALVSGWAAVGAAAVIAFFFDVASPVESVLIVRWTPGARRGLAFGIRNGIGTIAAPLGVLLVSHLYGQQTGFGLLFAVLGALVAAIFAAAIFLPSEEPKPAEAGA
jgi:MFS family permease